MARYSPERKEAILKKMAPPHNMNVAELASQEGISTATLYNWRKAARVRGAVLPSNSAKPDQWSSEEKFRIVLETAPMTEAELSELGHVVVLAGQSINQRFVGSGHQCAAFEGALSCIEGHILALITLSIF